MIRRKPNGQWCAPFNALWEWLPVLMSQSGERDVFHATLRMLGRHCVGRAAERYSEAAVSYSPHGRHRNPEDASASWGVHRHELAQKWLRKRDLLLKCLKDIEAIDSEGTI